MKKKYSCQTPFPYSDSFVLGWSSGILIFLKPHQVILIQSQLDENHFSVARVLHPGYTSESLGGALKVICLCPIFRDADSPGVGCSLSTIASQVT